VVQFLCPTKGQLKVNKLFKHCFIDNLWTTKPIFVIIKSVESPCWDDFEDTRFYILMCSSSISVPTSFAHNMFKHCFINNLWTATPIFQIVESVKSPRWDNSDDTRFYILMCSSSISVPTSFAHDMFKHCFINNLWTTTPIFLIIKSVESPRWDNPDDTRFYIFMSSSSISVPTSLAHNMFKHCFIDISWTTRSILVIIWVLESPNWDDHNTYI
jgi:hypothetical protein